MNRKIKVRLAAALVIAASMAIPASTANAMMRVCKPADLWCMICSSAGGLCD